MLISVDSPTSVIELKAVVIEEDHNNGSKADNVGDPIIGSEDLVGVDELSPNTIKQIEVVCINMITKEILEVEQSWHEIKKELKVHLLLLSHHMDEGGKSIAGEVADEVVVDVAKIVKGEERIALHGEDVQSVQHQT